MDEVNSWLTPMLRKRDEKDESEEECLLYLLVSYLSDKM